MFVLPAIAGVAIGILSGLLGIGGGTVMVPIFRLAFGMSPSFPRPRRCSPLFPRPYRARHPIYAIKRASCRLAWRQPRRSAHLAFGRVACADFARLDDYGAAALIIGWSAVKMLGKAFKMRSQNRTQQHAASSSTIEPDEAPSSV